MWPQHGILDKVTCMAKCGCQFSLPLTKLFHYNSSTCFLLYLIDMDNATIEGIIYHCMSQGSMYSMRSKAYQGWKIQNFQTCPSDKCQKIYLSDDFSTCLLVKFYFNDSHFAGATTSRIDRNFSPRQPPLRFSSDKIFTCPGHKDSL